MAIRFDHVVYAVPDLQQASTFFRTEWGLHVAEGGAHPNWGTHNSLCHFGLAYVELVAVQDPVRARESEFGRSVLHRAERGGGLVTAALATDDLDGAVARLQQNGVAVDGPFEGRRQRPDGSLLQWRMAWPAPWGKLTMPFLIQWQQSDAEREAELKRRGLLVDQPMVLGPIVYAVPDLELAGEAFRRWYGEEAGPAYTDGILGGRCAQVGRLGIILCESGNSPPGPRVLCAAGKAWLGDLT